MEGNRLLAVLSSVSVIGVVCLLAYSLSIQPVVKGIGEIGDDDIGTLVRIEGVVARAWKSSRGDLNLIVADGENHIRVYVPGGEMPGERIILPGSRISAKGEVQSYKGEIEIYVSSIAEISLLGEPGNDWIPPMFLAEMPDVFAGERVRVRGVVQGITVLRDHGKLNLTAHGLWIEADLRREVSFSGKVDVYGSLVWESSGWRILVGEDDSIANHPSKTPEGYEEISLERLIELPRDREGMRVAVKDLDARFGAIGTAFEISADGYGISCIVFGWDWEDRPTGVSEGRNVIFEATWEYYPKRAMWQLVSDSPSFEA